MVKIFVLDSSYTSVNLDYCTEVIVFIFVYICCLYLSFIYRWWFIDDNNVILIYIIYNIRYYGILIQAYMFNLWILWDAKSAHFNLKINEKKDVEWIGHEFRLLGNKSGYDTIGGVRSWERHAHQTFCMTAVSLCVPETTSPWIFHDRH